MGQTVLIPHDIPVNKILAVNMLAELSFNTWVPPGHAALNTGQYNY